jgi:dienelactone hydrolase
MKKLLLIFLLICSFASYGQWAVATGSTVGRQLVIQVPITDWNQQSQALLWTPDDTAANPGKRYPLVIFLHGAGQGQTNDINEQLQESLPRIISEGFNPYGIDSTNGDTVKYFVLSPHAYNTGWSYSYGHIKWILKYIKESTTWRNRIDTNRVFVTGFSAGGGGSWSCISEDTAWVAANLTGIVPVSSTEYNTDEPHKTIIRGSVRAKVVIWQVCGGNDAWNNTAIKYDSIVNNVPVPIPYRYGYKVVPGLSHEAGVWTEVYRPTNTWFRNNRSMWTRLATYTRIAPALPTLSVNAGPDSTLTMSPASTRWNAAGRDTAFVHGSVFNAVGTTTYTWSKISGTGGVILRPNDKNTWITDLSPGSYTFRLSVTADQGTVTDDINLTVTTCSRTTQRLSIGGDGGIFLSGGVAPGKAFILDSATAAANPAYIYLNGWTGAPGCPVSLETEGRAKMNNGIALNNVHWFDAVKSIARGSDIRISPYLDTVNLQVEGNFKKTVNGQFITYPGGGTVGVSLTGASTDVDIHNIEVFRTKYGMVIKDDDDCDTTLNYPYGAIYGVNVFNNWIHTTESQMFYFGNTVPDNGFLQSRAKGCNGTAFFTPGRMGGFNIYHNWADSTGRPGIQLSDHVFGAARVHHNHINYTGCQTDEAQGGGITLGGYTRAVVDSNDVQHSLTWNFMNFGSYAWVYDNTFRFAGYSAWTGNWIFSGGTVVGANPDVPATVNYGANIYIRTNYTRPMDSTRVWIRGNTMSDGRIIDINDANKYVMTLFSSNPITGWWNGNSDPWAYDNRTMNNTYNGTAFSGAPLVQLATYTPPIHIVETNTPYAAVLSAGVDKRTYETSVALQGSVIPMGGTTISSLVWSKKSGPTGGAIQSPNTLWTIISGLTPGIYVYTLTVTDNLGTITTDDVQIFSGNLFPISVAGPNQTITLPTNSVTLAGSGSDADGSVLWHTWHLVSQTNPTSFLRPNITDVRNYTTTVTGFPNEAGTYTFRNTTVDNTGVYRMSDMVVTVQTAAVAPPPVADAGIDQTTILTSVDLDASNSHPSSGQTLTGYAWTKVSGPGSTSIPNPNNQRVTANGLLVGVYVFRVTVTQNDGQTAIDDVQVTVNQAPPPIYIKQPKKRQFRFQSKPF